jgi:hypothetical protein
MKNLCLACKEMQLFITPYMYSTMVLPIQIFKRGVPGLKSSVHKRDQGLKHIRRFRILGDDRDSSPRVIEVIARLLQYLPRDTLSEFKYVMISLLGGKVLTLCRITGRGDVSYEPAATRI